MAARIPDSLERLTQADLIGVVRDLIGEVGRLRAENEKLGGAFMTICCGEAAAPIARDRAGARSGSDGH